MSQDQPAADAAPAAEAPAQAHPDHDAAYEAFFQLVGTQAKTETYEDLAKLLPSLKNTDPVELKQLASEQALRHLLKPSVDPLRLEYEQAAAEEDMDDLSTEEGDWIDPNAKDDAEELDENGIPVVKLSRASSSFILDGPGDVKFDNFTPEGDPDAAALAGTSAAAAAPAAPEEPPAYVPTALARAVATVAAPAAAHAAAPAAAAAGPLLGSSAAVPRRLGSGVASGPPLASGPVVTLEDELRALAARRAAPSAASPATPAPAVPDSAAAAPHAAGDFKVADVASDDEDAPKLIMEPPSQSLILPRPGEPSTGPAGAGGLPGQGQQGEGGEAEEGAAGPGRGRAGAAAGAQQGPSCLPGECVDTSAEDAYWRQLHGAADAQALLEHMGLGPAEPASSGQEAQEQPAQPAAGSGTAGAAAAAANGPLANGHAHPHGSAAPAGGNDANGHAPEASGVGAAGAEGGGSTAAAAAEGSRPAAALPAGGPGGAAAAAAASTVGSSAQAAAEGGESSGAIVLAGPAAQRQAPAAEGATFEEVEAFSLDPDFDYDNVVLTPREFPYSMLNARWPGTSGR